MYRDKISIANNTSAEAVQIITQWVQELDVSRGVMMDEEGMYEEFFLSPGAYTRLYGVVDQLPHTEFVKGLGGNGPDHVGFLVGIPCRSPVFVRSYKRDLEGLADYQIEYRICGGTE